MSFDELFLSDPKFGDPLNREYDPKKDGDLGSGGLPKEFDRKIHKETGLTYKNLEHFKILMNSIRDEVVDTIQRFRSVIETKSDQVVRQTLELEIDNLKRSIVYSDNHNDTYGVEKVTEVPFQFHEIFGRSKSPSTKQVIELVNKYFYLEGSFPGEKYLKFNEVKVTADLMLIGMTVTQSMITRTGITQLCRFDLVADKKKKVLLVEQNHIPKYQWDPKKGEFIRYTESL